MAIKDYFEEHCLQEKTFAPSGFPPPDDKVCKHVDGAEVRGLFVQSQSDNVIVASARGIKTRGRFAAPPDAPLSDGDVVRRKRDGLLIRIIGDPIQSPAQAESSFKTFAAEAADRGDVVE